MQLIKNCIGPTISIGQERWCLPYAGFLYSKSHPAKTDNIYLITDCSTSCMSVLLSATRFGISL